MKSPALAPLVHYRQRRGFYSLGRTVLLESCWLRSSEAAVVSYPPLGMVLLERFLPTPKNLIIDSIVIILFHWKGVSGRVMAPIISSLVPNLLKVSFAKQIKFGENGITLSSHHHKFKKTKLPRAVPLDIEMWDQEAPLKPSIIEWLNKKWENFKIKHSQAWKYQITN